MPIYKIEDGVPRLSISGNKSLYPFRDMKAGQSFFVAIGPDEFAKKKKLISAANNYASRTKTKLSYRSLVENGVAGVRVWRIR